MQICYNFVDFNKYMVSSSCGISDKTVSNRDNLAGIQRVRRICVWSVKEGMNFSLI